MTLLHGDCLELMQQIPDGSVDMVLCDLPYGSIKGAQLKGWNENTTAWDERLDEKKLFGEYERVLRQNGIAVLFSQEPYTSELRSHPKQNIEFCYPLIWRKDHFANPLMARKAPVSYFEDLSVFYKRHDSQLLNPLREYFQNILEFIGASNCKEINEKLGHRKAEHCFYVTSGKKKVKEQMGGKADHMTRVGTSQFALCTESTYNELVKVFGLDKMSGFKPFSELETIDKQFKEKYSRTFNIPNGQKFVSNVLDFKKDYQRLHPTQKPVALLEYLIKTYTNPGETVLDNCMGSGSTGVACVNTGRNFIGIELDPHYFEVARQRIENTNVQLRMEG